MSQLYRHVSEAVTEARQLQAVKAAHPDAAALTTGLDVLDRRTREAWDAGQVVVIAAGTGQGKTALSAQLAVEFAAQDSLLHFILEDEDRDAVNRQMAAVARADVTSLRRGQLVEDGNVIEAAEYLSSLNYHTVDRLGLTVEQIGTIAGEWKRSEGVERGIVVIDQLSHIVDTNSRTDTHPIAKRAPRVGDERAQIEWKMKVLKMVAEQTGTLVIVLVQHNENHGDSRPGIGSLRGSRGIGHYATLVLHIHRPKFVEDPFARTGEPPMPAPEGYAEAVCSKFRLGPEGWHEPVQWIGRQQRFADPRDPGDDPYLAPDAPSEQQKAGARALAELRARFEADRRSRQGNALAQLQGQAPRQVRPPTPVCPDDDVPPPDEPLDDVV